MKKSIVFILSIFFISTFTKAQISVMPYVQGGVSALTNTPTSFLTLSSYSESDYKPGFGYAAGLLVNYKFNKHIEIRTGIEYQNSGIRIEERYINDPNYATTVTYTGIGVVDRTKRQSNSIYTNIPIQFQYNFRTNKSIVPYIALGGNLGWFTKERFFTEGYLENEFVGEISKTYNNTGNVLFAGLNLDFGIQRKINEKFSFNAFVSGDMYLARLGKYAKFGLPLQPFNVSLGLGLAYSIQRK